MQELIDAIEELLLKYPHISILNRINALEKVLMDLEDSMNEEI